MPFDGTEFFPSPRPFRGAFGRGLRARLEPQQPETAPFAPPDPRTAALGLLEAAKRLIEDERDWVQRAYKTASGQHCAMGALHAAAGGFDDAVLILAHWRLLHAARTRGFQAVERMNDCSTHADVLAAFDEAIAAARRAAQRGSTRRQPAPRQDARRRGGD